MTKVSASNNVGTGGNGLKTFDELGRIFWLDYALSWTPWKSSIKQTVKSTYFLTFPYSWKARKSDTMKYDHK
jgi:hypothetical protein